MCRRLVPCLLSSAVPATILRCRNGRRSVRKDSCPSPSPRGDRDVFGGGDSVLTPLDGSLSCRRLPTGVRPVLPDGLAAPDRDLALRLRNDPRLTQWWALDLHGMHAQLPGGQSVVSPPPAQLVPLLLDATGATLA